MKKYILYLSLFCGAISFFSACSNEEDVTPSNADQNLFLPSDGDNSQTAQLRRDFANKFGSYLIFNDTLKHVQNGVDVYNNPIWNTETVDLDYSQIGTSASYYYAFKYLSDYASQSKATQLIQTKLTSRLGKAVPYSILLVDSITCMEKDNGKFVIRSYPTYVLGNRCYAISMNGGKAYNDNTYFDVMFTKIVADKLSRSSSAKLTKFYSYGAKYYRKDKVDDLGYKEYFRNDSIARSLGFWQDYNKYYFALKDKDLSYFQTAIFQYSVSEIEQKFAAFPLVIERFKLLREVVEDMGVVLDK